VFDYIQSATGPWIECPVGITAREKATPPKTLVQEVASNDPGARVFVVHSEERQAFERALRDKAMDRVRTRLEKLQQRVAKGRLKAPEKIGAAAARILARNHGHRYYDWRYEDRSFLFFEHPVHFTREQVYEGKYVIQTEEPNLSAVDAVRLYKELSEVERAFADLKDVIDLRPIYHQTDNRVDAHIYVAALAFLLHRAIEKKLKAACLDLSATEALNVLKTSAWSTSTLATARPSAPSPPAPNAPPPRCARSALPSLIRPRHRDRVKPSCSDKPHMWP
jgi:transposase